jgi:flagellar biosynthesis GTPase FlhF
MTRNGKIARLPQSIREQINRRLQNGGEGKQITVWLNTLPEVAALMTSEFNGQPISEMNVSNWKAAGYLAWEEQQEVMEALRRFGADAAEVSQATNGRLADNMAVYLAARLAVELHKPPSEQAAANGQLERLRQFCANIAALRRGDQGERWLQLEREKLELEQKKYQEQADARKKEGEEALKDPLKKSPTKETLDFLAKELKLL